MSKRTLIDVLKKVDLCLLKRNNIKSNNQHDEIVKLLNDERVFGMVVLSKPYYKVKHDLIVLQTKDKKFVVPLMMLIISIPDLTKDDIDIVVESMMGRDEYLFAVKRDKYNTEVKLPEIMRSKIKKSIMDYIIDYGVKIA